MTLAPLKLRLYNTKNREVQLFTPLKAGHVGIYLCGPTVYDRAHIGNARPVVIIDVLRRLLSCYYDVTYVRNITDIDDKIIAAARQQEVDIATLTKRTTQQYHSDMAALGNIEPDIEPRATAHVEDMIAMITALVETGYAYQAEGHVLFDTAADPTYGSLSNQPMAEIIAGARVEVAPYKKNPADFVLWKPSTGAQPGWKSPFGMGRPGWHIECSAMCRRHLGATFDIHAGGQDLLFPHHENEVAQSTCLDGKDSFAQFWLHNGMLLVEGKKMSKSLGNFLVVADLLAQAPGEVIRYALLKTHYRQPLDWQEDTLAQSQASLNRLYGAVRDLDTTSVEAALKRGGTRPSGDLMDAVVDALSDDLNTPRALSHLHDHVKKINKTTATAEKKPLQEALYHAAWCLGLLRHQPHAWFQNPGGAQDDHDVAMLIAERARAKKQKDFATADRIRHELTQRGIILEDEPEGTSWRYQTPKDNNDY